MTNLINDTIRSGFNYARKHKDAKEPPHITISSEAIREKLMTHSDRIKIKVDEMVKKPEFFAITFDAGTGLNISLPNSYEKCFLYES